MTGRTLPSIELPMRVAFSELDPMHVVWHGNYLKYFDAARFALFDAFGVDLYRYSVEKRIAFPVTRQSTKHILALRHNDAFVCRATVTEAEYKIAMGFEIRKAETLELCTRGSSEQVAVQVPEMELLFAIPEDIRSALGFDR
ncbi:MAG: acyl-CoA thioesterase [Desulfobacterales bacterium]|nr:acyl-CoA thioesterase [Desulfobacterales bacterium]